jgi:nicotinamidase-related amidase
VVDVTYQFVGDRREPVLESIRTFSNSCGEAGWDAMEQIRVLLETCRAAGVPIFYTKGTDRRSSTADGAWAWKNSRQLEKHDNRIPEMIEPREGETVIEKTKPSAFFGTPLASYLTALRVDTLIVTGGTTSGCVRATVVDAFSMNYRVTVPEDAVFDRGELAHAANLFDIDAKYGSVQSVAETLEYLRRVTAIAG